MYNCTFVNFQQTTILRTLTISLLISYLVKLSSYDGSNITFIGIYCYNYFYYATITTKHICYAWSWLWLPGICPLQAHIVASICCISLKSCSLEAIMLTLASNHSMWVFWLLRINQELQFLMDCFTGV